MPGPREIGEAVRNYILTNVEEHPRDISKLTAEQFSISKQAVNRHIGKLIHDGLLSKEGRAWTINYRLLILSEWSQTYPLTSPLDEYDVWEKDVQPVIGELSENVADIWRYGFTEMLNNAIDHSGGNSVIAQIKKTAVNTEMMILDDGVGIFKKIQNALNLSDERHAVLELAKGKLTTDKSKHSGEGIFFTSRIFDSFDIRSGGVHFSHEFSSPEDWISARGNSISGTLVWLKIADHSLRDRGKVYEQHGTPGEFSFDKTVVPVNLAQYGSDDLVSRSQAKRLLVHLDKFKTVVLDFKGVRIVGQGFADEVFRVFRREHPAVELVRINANDDIERMIQRVEAPTPPLSSTPPPSS
jgi:anti-sigma regulatory factor (Ser/Thr protein kinase)